MTVYTLISVLLDVWVESKQDGGAAPRGPFQQLWPPIFCFDGIPSGARVEEQYCRHRFVLCTHYATEA